MTSQFAISLQPDILSVIQELGESIVYRRKVQSDYHPSVGTPHPVNTDINVDAVVTNQVYGEQELGRFLSAEIIVNKSQVTNPSMSDFYVINGDEYAIPPIAEAIEDNGVVATIKLQLVGTAP